MRRPGRSAVYLGFSAILLLLLALPRASPRASDSPGPLVPLEVRNQALQEGSGRVIVELRLPGGPHVPEGLFSAAAAGTQRSDIAVVQRQVLARLAGTSHRLLRQYRTVALLALEVGPDAIAELEASSFWVKRVIPDAVKAPTLPQSVPLIGGDQAWARGFDGSGMVVAIIDTGVQSSHPLP